jgi:hypothetical protein
VSFDRFVATGVTPVSLRPLITDGNPGACPRVSGHLLWGSPSFPSLPIDWSQVGDDVEFAYSCFLAADLEAPPVPLPVMASGGDHSKDPWGGSPRDHGW